MNDTVTRAREMITARLSEIDTERARLERALKALEGRSAPSATAARPTGTGSRRGRRGSRRARPGERDDQLLASIQKNPKHRVSDHARELGVSPQQLYPVLRRLQKKSLIKRGGRSFVAKGKQKAGAAT